MKRICLVVLLAVALPAGAAHHVRVVLDLSRSMQTNDPKRLAVLSTMLLHDLARPNSTTGDSFRVVPFDLAWSWSDPSAAPPTSTQTPITAEYGRRDAFQRAVAALPYDARMTYFYPGLAAALQDLEQVQAGAGDVRAIVMITDGVPEAATRDVELQRIRTELVPRLARQGIRLYILAFGGEADRNRDFFKSMLATEASPSLGEFFVDPQGERLLSYMVDIFSRSFGYSPDAARAVGGTSSLDLESRVTPEHVAVVVLSPAPQPPSLRLTPPPDGSVNAPEGRQSSAAAGGSYSLMWVLAPAPGAYGFASDAAAGQVAVLRPTRLAIEILPAPPLKQTERALAATRFPLRLLVHPQSGVQGDPGPVDLTFRTLGPRVFRDGEPAHAWTDDWRAPVSGAGTPTPRGRVYEIVAEFRENGERANEMYVGYIEAEVRRGEARVGALTGVRAHRVEVHPRLSVAPVPLTSYASSNALERKESVCTQFSFVLAAGQLPRTEKPGHAMRIVLSAPDPAMVSRELHEATFTLDGQTLDLSGAPTARPGPWYKGKSLAPAQLLSKHDLCVRIGRPKAGDPSHPLDLKLVATLLKVPYDEFGVVQPFTLKVLVAPPTFLERWRKLLLSGIALLSLLALLWYSRARPELPPDLQYAIARESSGGDLVAHALAERPLGTRLLGLAGERAVVGAGDVILGRLRPSRTELYQFRPARGVQIEPCDANEELPLHRGLASMGVQRTYRLRAAGGAYVLRLEYR